MKKGTAAHYAAHKETARALAKQKIAQYTARYTQASHTFPATLKRLSIRNQRTRWGSCSRAGNINFNYKIALLPERLADYIVVHELCHLGEFNHSPAFWDLVAVVIPDHRARRAELRQIERDMHAAGKTGRFARGHHIDQLVAPRPTFMDVVHALKII